MIERKLIDECVHCGFCLPSCPTYQSWNEEMDSPRGRIYLMKSLTEGRELTGTIIEHFDRCLGCMACVTACPSGVKYDALIMQTRAEVEHARRSLFRSLLFTMLPYPKRMKAMLLPQMLGRPFFRFLGLLPAIRRRHFTSKLAEFTPAKPPRRARVALLAGCVQRVYFPEVNEATVRVLAAEGCDVVVPRDLGCCGALSAHAGRDGEARRFESKALDAIARANVDAVVVNAAGCGSWMKEWNKVPVRDVSEFLVDLGPREERHPIQVRAAYHDACHLAHAQRIRAQPRTLLRQIPGLELLEIPDGDTCCGSAGIYNLVEPESAREIGERKVDNVLSVDPQLLVSANPGCTLQIARILRERGRALPALHIVELLDASISGRASQPLPQ
ncbi:MAG TPA: heterodisulfide reductase-related iron-sulfur binding cluster [Thermoanaerobaculia bacterium]|nr:heterodisulfide reductase-related iron-sulfur binding cluster [Thermoanaerobaculia bacterium]